jgi:predicted transcriptional regulator
MRAVRLPVPSGTGIIGLLDDLASFYEPDRRDVQLISFYQDYLEDRFPNCLPAGARPDSLCLSMESCSEALLFNLDLFRCIALVSSRPGDW